MIAYNVVLVSAIPQHESVIIMYMYIYSPSQASTVHEPRTSRCSSWIEKAEEPEVKLPTSGGSSKNQESSRKTSTSALLTTPKPLTVWITINCGKFFKRWEYQAPDLPPEKSV